MEAIPNRNPKQNNILTDIPAVFMVCLIYDINPQVLATNVGFIAAEKLGVLRYLMTVKNFILDQKVPEG